MTPSTTRNRMSSNCCRVTGRMPCLMRRMPSHQAAAKPARYMSPYQRTASGPIWKAMGSMSGWVSKSGLCEEPRVSKELGRGGARTTRAPRQPQLEHRMPVGELPVDHAAPPKVRHRLGHYGDAEAAGDEAHY